MRQIRPRISYREAAPTPVPGATAPSTEITVDLRDPQVRHPSYTEEARIRRQLVTVRAAVATLMDQLAALVDERENLKARLGALAAGSSPGASSPVDDQSVVAWGFYDDDL
jgi:hypothetical protein